VIVGDVCFEHEMRDKRDYFSTKTKKVNYVVVADPME